MYLLALDRHHLAALLSSPEHILAAQYVRPRCVRYVRMPLTAILTIRQTGARESAYRLLWVAVFGLTDSIVAQMSFRRV